MSELYPNGADQLVGDDVWIADVSARGWVALAKDASIIRAHNEALAASTLRVFALDNASIAGDEMARRFEVNLNRILQRARKPRSLWTMSTLGPRWTSTGRCGSDTLDEHVVVPVELSLGVGVVRAMMWGRSTSGWHS